MFRLFVTFIRNNINIDMTERLNSSNKLDGVFKKLNEENDQNRLTGERGMSSY